MKKIYFLGFFLIAISAYGQFKERVINVNTNELVYDAITDRVYASIPSTNGENGNSIGVINPQTYELENTTFIGSDPTVLAISDDGQYIYAGFETSSSIRRYTLADQTSGLQFALGNDSSTGAYYAEDIEVMPGQPGTIAVSRKNLGFSPSHEGVAIYDDGVMRATTTQDHTGSNQIEFVNEHQLFGYNNETTEFGLRQLTVDDSGVNEDVVYDNILTQFNTSFIYRDNFIYGTNGQIINVTGTPFVAGQFNNANGPVVYDIQANLIVYGYSDGNQISLKRYNPSTFLEVDTIPVTEVFGTVKSITTCGEGCYALNTEQEVLLLLDEKLNQPDHNYTNLVKLYPNPAQDVFYIEKTTLTAIQFIDIYDINGRKIDNLLANTQNIYDISHLKPGVYVAHILHIDGKKESKRLIKT